MKDPVLKYPVILVHGVLAHDRKSINSFWGRIPDVLKNYGINVFFGNTDAWGSIESNAKMLKATIDRVLSETNSKKANIIAHSKGGLDSRFLIREYDYGEKIASLNTVSTPHHGSELADLLFQQKFVHSKTAKNALKVFGKLYGDTNPDLYSLNCQLTTEKMKQFNENIKMDQRVFYQSVYTTMRNPFDYPVFFYSYLYIKSVSGANDGVISEASANWSGNVTKIEGISHAEIVDFKKRKISGIDIPDIYLNITKDLGKRGF